MDSGAHSPDGDAALFGDLCVGEPGNIAKYDCGTEFLGERRDRSLEMIRQRFHRQCFIGARRAGEHTIRIIWEVSLGPALSAPGFVEEYVGHDAGKPSLKRAGGVALQTTFHAEERFLHNVFGIGLVPRQPIGDGIHKSEVIAGDPIPCRDTGFWGSTCLVSHEFGAGKGYRTYMQCRRSGVASLVRLALVRLAFAKAWLEFFLRLAK